MKIVRTYLPCLLGATIALLGCTRFDESNPFYDRDANPSTDAQPDDPCLDWTYTPAHFDPCAIIDPQGGLILDIPGEYTYNTDFESLTDPDGNPVAHARQARTDSDPVLQLVSVDSLAIADGVTLRAVGTRPLLIASWSTITVDGTIDVSSSLQNGQGAGANTGTCNAATAGQPDNDDGDGDIGGGGGGGGGFGADGGAGGAGGEGDGPAGAAGTALGATPTQVRGGCAGARGAAGDGNDGSGAGGAGGGAVQLTARVSITVNGALHAGGAGGNGADGELGGYGESRRSGGGGSGSGGMLGLEAPAIEIGADAILAANGGGGGGGGTNYRAGDGEDGQLDDTAANPGSREGMGGDGGDGGFVNAPHGQPGEYAIDGGGGGGGGVGYIIMSTTPTSSGSPKFSPPYVTQ